MSVEIESKPLRAILFTSPADGEPSPDDQYDQLVTFAESRGFQLGWYVPFSDPVPGRMMVSPAALKSLPASIDLILYVDHGRPVAYPVRSGVLLDAETRA